MITPFVKSRHAAAQADAEAFKKCMKCNDIRRALYACDNDLLGKMFKVNKEFQSLALEDFVCLYQAGQLRVKAKIGLANAWMEKVGIDSTTKYLENYLGAAERIKLKEINLPFRIAFSFKTQNPPIKTGRVNKKIKSEHFKNLCTLRILSPTPADILSLVDLKSLNISSSIANSFKQIFTDYCFLKDFPNLDSLHLDCTDNPNKKFLNELHKVKRFKHLRIYSECQLDLNFLETLPKLKTLNIAGCNNVKDFKCLKSVSHLKNLNIKKCNASKKNHGNHLSFLTSLKKLEKLELTIHSEKNVIDLNLLPNLKSLDIELNSFPLKIFKGFEHAKNLKNLKISNCVYITLNFQCLKALNNLETLSLQYLYQCEDLENLTQIKELKISSSNFDNLNFLTSLTKLDRLDLDSCNFKIPNELEFLESLPIKTIMLDEKRIKG